MGGFGTWAVAAEYPGRFAAAVPICGGGEPDWAERMRDLPLWVFHGGKDEVVPIGKSEEMVEALRSVGGDVRFTVYPEVGHDCWTKAYGERALWEWMLGKRRKGEGRRGDREMGRRGDGETGEEADTETRRLGDGEMRA